MISQHLRENSAESTKTGIVGINAPEYISIAGISDQIKHDMNALIKSTIDQYKAYTNIVKIEENKLNMLPQ